MRSFLLSLAILTAGTAPGIADADPFLGEIDTFPYTFCPQGWVQPMGQLLPISQNTALFSLLGTNYGGNGTSNFALPTVKQIATLNPGQPLIQCMATIGIFPSRN